MFPICSYWTVSSSLDFCFGLPLLSRWYFSGLYCLLLIAILGSDGSSSSSSYSWVVSVWLLSCVLFWAVSLGLHVLILVRQAFVSSCISFYLEILLYWFDYHLAPSVSDILHHIRAHRFFALDSSSLPVASNCAFLALLPSSCMRYFVRQVAQLEYMLS